MAVIYTEQSLKLKPLEPGDGRRCSVAKGAAERSGGRPAVWFAIASAAKRGMIGPPISNTH